MKTTDFTGLEKGSRSRDEQGGQSRSTDGAMLEQQANPLQEQPTQAGDPVKVPNQPQA